MSVITLQQYKEYVGINNPNEDTKLERLVEYTNAFIEKYCNTKFTPTSVVDKILTTTTQELILPEAPIVTIDALYTMDYNAVETEVTTFYVEPEVGIVTLANTVTVPFNTNNIKVSYTYGYADVPVGLLVPAFELVTHMFKREYVKSKNNSLGESVTYLDPSVIPVQVRSGLDLYRML